MTRPPASPETPDTVILADEILTPSHALRPGWLRTNGRTIDSLASGATPPAGAPSSTGEVVRLPSGWRVVPGLVDMHVHGAGGGDMTAVDRAQMVAAGTALLEAGITTTVVSLVAAPIEELERAVGIVADLVSDDAVKLPHFAGTHLEGPFLSVHHRGAHDASSLQCPSTQLLKQMVSAAHGTIRMVTVAPELPGGLAFVEALVDRGIVAAMGHTGASHQQTVQAIERGITVGTHLFNGMRGPHHREPGPVFTLLDDDRVTVELINDGHHVHPTAARVAVRASADGRLALISDAVAATNAHDGRYQLGRVQIRRQDGKIQTADGSSLGGGTVTLDVAMRNAVTTLGLAVDQAVRAATSVPAAALGINDRAGTLAAGREADLCVLDADLKVAGIMRAGRWVRHPVEPTSTRNPSHDAGVNLR